MKTRMIDLEVDYIDSRSITKKELEEISEYIRNEKFNAAKFSVRARRMTLRRKKELA